MKENQIAIRPLAIIEAKFDLEAKQNDIIDMLFTELNKDDGKLEYEINIEKYKKYYNVDTSNIYRDLKKAVKLFEKSKGVTIYNPITDQEEWYSWFSKITYANKEGKIFVRLDPEFKSILTEVKRRISYDVENTLRCASKYSKRLYYYLKSFENTGWRLDNVEELKDKLKVPSSYKSYSKFKQGVLNVAHREINELTDINYEYEEIKDGRKVVRIKFDISSKRPRSIKEIAVDVMENNNYTELSVEENEIYRIVGDRVSKDELNNIIKALDTNFDKCKDEYTDKKVYLEKQIEYLDEYVKGLETYKYNALLIDALKKDYYSKKQKAIKTIPTKRYSKNKGKQLRFNDFEQREYDYDSLEEKLLGWDKD